ncbi:MAG: DUF2997 domain-containing protein [Planctomycetota bacterium]
MTPEELEITVEKDGKVVVHMKGVKGRHCVDFTNWLAAAVGRTADVTLTSEHYEPDIAVRIDATGRARS